MHAQYDALRQPSELGELLERLAPYPLDTGRAVHALQRLVACGYGDLPLPGSGHTLRRWQALAQVAGADLALLKLYEAHTDAVAILAELGATVAPGTWGVWAAETPGVHTSFEHDDSHTEGRLFGRKRWCSGGNDLDHALLTARTTKGAAVLVHVALDQPGVRCRRDGWHAVGMAATGTSEMSFDGAVARRIGKPGAYLQRAGFWHGSLGIAACWFGAARAIAALLRRSKRVQRDAHAQAHLGAIDAQLFAARCVLHAAATAIDAAPTDDAHVLALRVRMVVEAAASEAMWRVGRALGAAPLCTDAVHARRCADLTTFLRQSHAEADLQALGSLCVHEGGPLACAVCL